MTQAVNVASLGVAMTADSSGNVGIGTSSPSYKLQVAGSTRVTSTYYDGAAYIQSNGSDEISVYAGGDERAKFGNTGNFQFNSGYGSVATAYGCRSWVNFNGTGTVAIRASGNVSSITDNGVGLYRINFTNAMSDANYNIVGTSATASGAIGVLTSVAGAVDFAKTTTTVNIMTIITNSSTPGDYNSVNVSIFR